METMCFTKQFEDTFDFPLKLYDSMTYNMD